MKGKNFLKLNPARKKTVFAYAAKRKWTWDIFYKHYKQPPWCTYHEALRGQWGCFTLVGVGDFSSKLNYKEKCRSCECSIHNEEYKKLYGNRFIFQ
jgi:hypothetical protein